MEEGKVERWVEEGKVGKVGIEQDRQYQRVQGLWHYKAK